MIQMQENDFDIAADNSLQYRLQEMIASLALIKREITLASGQKSDVYLDCRQVYFRGEAQFIIGELFYKRMLAIESESLGFAACGGMAMGSIPLSCALSAAAFRRGRELAGFAVRKTAKDYGMKSVVEGDSCLQKGDRVLLVEDVVTTGSSAISAINAVREFGVHVDTLFSIVDREQGGADNLLREGVRLVSLFTLKDFVR